jgi:phosphoglucosamine mutase
VVDECGSILDGDQIMAICAQDMIKQGRLPGNVLITTVMSTMALEVFIKNLGGTVVRTPVGDRHVVEAMRKHNAMLGGEQSGHLIFREYSTTGDGLLAALQILRIMQERKKPLSELAGQLKLFPQELINVEVQNKRPFDEIPAIADETARIEKELGGKGRVLLRYSGTEPLVRVMVEGTNEKRVRKYAEELAEVVSRELK